MTYYRDAHARITYGEGARGRVLTATERAERHGWRNVRSYNYYRLDAALDFCHYTDTGDQAIHAPGTCPHCDAARAAGLVPNVRAMETTRAAQVTGSAAAKTIEVQA